MKLKKNIQNIYIYIYIYIYQSKVWGSNLI